MTVWINGAFGAGEACAESCPVENSGPTYPAIT